MFDATFASRHGEPDADPLPAMLAKYTRLWDLATEKRTAGDKIFFALPEEIQRECVMVKFPEVPERIMGKAEFEALIRLQQRMNAAYARADGLDETEEAVWIEENVIEPARAQWRAGMAEIASGARSLGLRGALPRGRRDRAAG